MLTRLQKKLQQQAGEDALQHAKTTRQHSELVDKIADETKQKPQGKSNQPVRLNENLLFMVNKNLKKMDKAARDEKINTFTKQPHPSNRPFTEVVYRKSSSRDLSQTQLAVMHTTNFNSSSTAVCEYSSTAIFLPQIYDFKENIQI